MTLLSLEDARRARTPASVPDGRLASLDYAKPLQDPAELVSLIALLKRENVRNYLEIGVRYGGSFEGVLMALGPQSSGVAIDFPGHHFGDKHSVPILLSTIARLKRNGRLVEDVIFGPSAAPEVVDRAGAAGPYDAVLIDGDHSYDAVKRDFELYAPMARLVILHDIAAGERSRSKDGRAVEVEPFWHEIRGRYKHIEIVAPNSLMGVGVLWMPA